MLTFTKTAFAGMTQRPPEQNQNGMCFFAKQRQIKSLRKSSVGLYQLTEEALDARPKMEFTPYEKGF